MFFQGMDPQNLCGDVTMALMATPTDVKVPVVVTSGLLDRLHMSSLLTLAPHPSQATKPRPLLKPSSLRYQDDLREASGSLQASELEDTTSP